MSVFSFPVTVRYMEVDAQGVVFNGWYLTWFDEAMTYFLADRGLAYQAMVAEGFDVQLVRSEIDFKAGVRWGDPVEVLVSPSKLGNTSFALDFQVRRNGDEVTTNGRTTYVVVNTADYTKRPIPDALRKALGDPEPLH